MAIASPPLTGLRTPAPVRWALRLGAVLLGALQAWVSRYDIPPDSVSYLNLSDAFAKGDYAYAMNAHWSPLYPWAYGQLSGLISPGRQSEALLVHAFAFLLFLIVIACFEFFLRELQRVTSPFSPVSNEFFSLPPQQPVSLETCRLVLAYSLFTWSTLGLIGADMPTPDLAVAATVYAASGLLVRMRRGAPSRTSLVVFGVVLGVGYLLKSAMFPAGFLFLACAAWSLERGFRTRLAYSMLSFGVIAGAQIAALSRTEGFLTFGESGALNYYWYLNPNASEARSYLPIAPRDVAIVPVKSDTARILHRSPVVLEFKSRDGWSYPLWDDPVYWSGHPRLRFSLRRQVEVSTGELVHLLLILAPCLVGLALLVAARRSLLRPARDFTPTMASGAGIVAMFLLVHVEPRYVAASVVTLFLPLYWTQTTPSVDGRIFRARFVLLAAAIQFVALGWGMRHQVGTILRYHSGSRASFKHLQLARQLEHLGLRPGDRVGSIGWARDGYWARLARVQIAMEIPESEARQYWTTSQAQRRGINELFAHQNMRMIVANRVPDGAATEGWRPLEIPGYFVLPLALH